MKKLVLISSVLLTFIIGIYLFNYSSKSKSVLSNNSSQQITNFNAITMMYETESGSGEYKVASDTSWPLEGYIFNAEMSSCEKGSTLRWDEENKKVLMQANTSDKCYVYFDKYILPTIDNLVINEITSTSITLTVNAINGDGNIITYHYSNDNGKTYISSANNSYTFTDLTAETQYNLSVFVTDNNGKNSEQYNINATTSNGIINFLVDGEAYYAQEGMTWYEWVNSEYNGENFEAACDDPSRGIFKGSRPVVIEGLELIYGTDLIIADKQYYLGDVQAIICF